MKEKHNFLEYFTMEKKHLRPALSAFLLMLTMSILSKALSFFVAPVCEDLGFGRGSFTLYYSLMVAAGAADCRYFCHGRSLPGSEVTLPPLLSLRFSVK